MCQHRDSSPNSDQLGRRVPVINFPDDWNQNGGRSSPEVCKVCKWAGDASSLFHWQMHRTMGPYESARASSCISCQFSSAVLESCVFLAFNTNPNPKSTLVMNSTIKDDNKFQVLYRKGMLDCSPMLSVFMPSEISADKGTSPPLGIPQRRSDIDTSSHRTSSWAHDQISQCLQTHSSCADFTGATGTFLPTRLIDLEHFHSSKDVVLIESTDLPIDTRYVALSYCWGKDQAQCQTTRATLEERKQRIPWSSLPQTFKDAVRFARSLHTRYLWIDGVCIIQGDAADWNYESGKMFDVYRNAYVTLAAVWGDSSTSGLFSTSQGKLVAELTFKNHSWPLHAFKSHSQYPYWAPDADKLEEPSSLFKRAWAFQERLISPRVLFFTKHDLYFECFSHMACDCGYMQNTFSIWLAGLDTEKHTFFRVLTDRTGHSDAENETDRKLNVGEDPDESDNAWSDCSPYGSESDFSLSDYSVSRSEPNQLRTIESFWRETVGKFSMLQISFESDRLPAIGAIAQEFSRRRPNELYLAGLWSGSLLHDLLWHREVEDNPGPLSARRPGTHTNPGMSQDAPSWSWAFCGAEVDWSRHGSGFNLVGANKAEIIEAKCWYKNNNPFGSLDKASLMLRSELFPCWMTRKSKNPEAEDYMVLHCCSGYKLRLLRLSQCYIDMPNERYVQEHPLGFSYRVYIFFVGENISAGSRNSELRTKFYLLLRSVDRQKNIFRRLGVLYWEQDTDEDIRQSTKGAVKHNSDQHEKIGEEATVVSNHLIRKRREGIETVWARLDRGPIFQEFPKEIAMLETITII